MTNAGAIKNMKRHDFQWLQKWYQLHCNGDWEHGSGVLIETLDNPGWSLTIDLLDTELEHKKFKELKKDTSEEDWYFCTVKDQKFEGRCGAANLPEVFQIFRSWAES